MDLCSWGSVKTSFLKHQEPFRRFKQCVDGKFSATLLSNLLHSHNTCFTLFCFSTYSTFTVFLGIIFAFISLVLTGCSCETLLRLQLFFLSTLLLVIPIDLHLLYPFLTWFILHVIVFVSTVFFFHPFSSFLPIWCFLSLLSSIALAAINILSLM